MRAGTLFTQDYLARGIDASPAFRSIQADLPARLESTRALFAAIADPTRLNEAQLEDRLVKPLLDLLGWTGCWSVQERAEQHGRRNVPDYLLFADAEAFAAADGQDARGRYRHACAVADAKAWGLNLDRRGHGAGQDETPAGQILRYLSRANAISERRVRYAVLTNGRQWRLYAEDAKAPLQDYFEVDLAWALGLQGAQGGLGELAAERTFALFQMFFGRAAFVPDAAGRTAHDHALAEGRLWETRVRDDLAAVVFQHVYPGLIQALIAGDPERPPDLDPPYLTQVREAALTALYRLLFCLYAEDRDLLPRRDRGFDEYTLTRLRDHVARKVDDAEQFSTRLDNLWRQASNLFELIDTGDDSLGVPPYNGGLFAPDRSALLNRARLSDRAFAPLLDKLSRRLEGGELLRINYRDLSVRELGSIYERLLEFEPARQADAPGGVVVRLNTFARKGSGSYYTPDVLVRLIVERTLGPLVRERLEAFEAAVEGLARDRASAETVRAELDAKDPAGAILALKVCDPAMGSGHFLVSLIDWLSREVFTAIGEAKDKAAEAGFTWTSPLQAELERLRAVIVDAAAVHRWRIEAAQLDDANLVKRLVLKRCVYGVDKNPMAVELAKVALWLHTFTAGAPLSFLDHHLRCGDSLFGEWVDEVAREAAASPGRGKNASLLSGAGLFLQPAVSRALGAETAMRAIERLSDGLLSEVEESAAQYADVEGQTRALKGFLDFRQALRWLKPQGEDAAAVRALLDGQFGDAVNVVAGLEPLRIPPELAGEADQPDLIEAEAAPEQLSLLPGQAGVRDYLRARRLVAAARALAAEQRFLHWQVAFPGVWRGWRDARTGGFDAVIGNPPWDRMKMQEVEWFADRAPAVARQVRAADRKAAVSALRGAPAGSAERALADAYDLAGRRAETAMEVARSSGAFPLMSRGDINLYSLFVERAQALIAPRGAAGLLTPSGVMSGKESAEFLELVFTHQRIADALEFYNRRLDGNLWFPDVYWRTRFCVFVITGRERKVNSPAFTFFFRGTAAPTEVDYVELDEETIRSLSPNVFSLPMFNDEIDARLSLSLTRHDLTTRFSDLNLRYQTAYHMAGDSAFFSTENRMVERGAYPVEDGRWRSETADFNRLFEGKMVQSFDHRAASVQVSGTKTFRTGDNQNTTPAEHTDPNFLAAPRFWVEDLQDRWRGGCEWVLAIKDITSATNARTSIGCILPKVGTGHSLPIFVNETKDHSIPVIACANINSLLFDFVCRFRVQTNHLTWTILKVAPVVPPVAYDRAFGPRTAREIVRDHVLRLSYTAHDLAAFARDMGHVEVDGTVKPPFRWDEAERRQLRARLDALYFILYGVTEAADVDHVLSTFPIVERKERAEHGVYLTRELIHWHMRALLAGDSDRDAPEAALIAAAHRRLAA